MHFNAKHIFNGDSEKDIKNKINYNFNQILSFAIGPDGHQGPMGPVGHKGPAGYKGSTGGTGDRGSNWYKQNTAPGSSSNPFDLWIDSSSNDYSVYVKSTLGTWGYSGYSLFNSSYFSSYSGILGPAGVTDKYAIGFKAGVAGLTASSASLVISDQILNSANSNPNRSKLVIATDDQTERPIFSFAKSGAISTGIPSFYWRNLGYNNNLKYTSNGGLAIESLLGFNIDTYTASTILSGRYATITASSSVSLYGTGDFYLYSNTTVGVGGNLTVASSNLFLSSGSFISYDPVTVQDTAGATGSYIFDTTKNLPPGYTTSSSGVEILATSNQNTVFEFRDLKNAPIFSGKPRGTVESGKNAQTTFGSTGGQSGGATGGPYLYHVSKVIETSQYSASYSVYYQSSNNPTTSSLYYINNILDITDPNIWASDMILVKPRSYTSSSNQVYLRIPSSYLSNLDGVYRNGVGNNYRIFLNDTTVGKPHYISGLVYTNYYNLNGAVMSRLFYIDFDIVGSLASKCLYVDIFYAPTANLNNGNPRVFWKTCNGLSGYITLSTYYSVGSVVSNPPKVVNSGGSQVLVKTTPTA